MTLPTLSRCCLAPRQTASTLRPAIAEHQWRLIHRPRVQLSAFSTSPVLLKRNRGPKKDKRISASPQFPPSHAMTNHLTALIRYFLQSPARNTPRPLRLSRLRSLRHWTIHRAWQLHKAQLRKAQELDLERQYNAMRDACEALRLIGDNGLPGGRNEGKLFRLAMEKKDVWKGVPIEYARTQTEWPAREGWNHEWTRG
jgi:large subunit ribosomal protein L40